MKKSYMFLTLSYIFWGLLINNAMSIYFCNVFEFLGNFKSLISLEQYKKVGLYYFYCFLFHSLCDIYYIFLLLFYFLLSMTKCVVFTIYVDISHIFFLLS